MTLPAQVRRPRQQLAERAQALRDALGVVETVHGEEDALAREALAQRGEGRPRLRVVVEQRGELLRRDADGQRVDARRVALGDHAVHLAGQADQAQEAGPEVLEVGVGLEGHEVRAQEAAQHLVAPGQDAQQLRGREGDVQEEPDARLGGDVAEHARQQHQVVVVDPHRVPGLQVLEDRVAEAPVRGHVGRPQLGVVVEARREGMEERPEGLVRVALVEAPGQRRRAGPPRRSRRSFQRSTCSSQPGSLARGP